MVGEQERPPFKFIFCSYISESPRPSGYYKVDEITQEDADERRARRLPVKEAAKNAAARLGKLLPSLIHVDCHKRHKNTKQPFILIDPLRVYTGIHIVDFAMDQVTNREVFTEMLPFINN